MGRRDRNDIEWKKVKEVVKARDDNKCRLIAILTLPEYYTYIHHAKSRFFKLDPAHIFPVSTYPKLCYEKDNIVMLNRWSHTHLDNCKSPITGGSISRTERDDWWKRIIGKKLYNNLLEKNKK